MSLWGRKQLELSIYKKIKKLIFIYLLENEPKSYDGFMDSVHDIWCKIESLGILDQIHKECELNNYIQKTIYTHFRDGDRKTNFREEKQSGLTPEYAEHPIERVDNQIYLEQTLVKVSKFKIDLQLIFESKLLNGNTIKQIAGSRGISTSKIVKDYALLKIELRKLHES
ncbi:MAG: hypothetical protein HAW67_04415 [Endozoicomonadaceae bacterium]|nr:hypothetical protein [Endozoicomonadaceae bacterium]